MSYCLKIWITMCPSLLNYSSFWLYLCWQPRIAMREAHKIILSQVVHPRLSESLKGNNNRTCAYIKQHRYKYCLFETQSPAQFVISHQEHPGPLGEYSVVFFRILLIMPCTTQQEQNPETLAISRNFLQTLGIVLVIIR